MRWKSTRPLLLVVMAVILAVQGVFAGVAICREDSGKTNLEWADNGQCDQPGALQIACVHDEAPSASHCGPCIDIPIPSDNALKSATLGSGLPDALHSRVLEIVPAPCLRASAAPLAVSRASASERLRSVRLLI